MRRYERQVFGKENICGFLDLFDTIYLGISGEEYPYVVPLNFGYEFEHDLIFYFHCALHGKKLCLLQQNPKVCVTASKFTNYVSKPFRGRLHDYRSVIAYGTASMIIDPTEKARATRLLLKQCDRLAQCNGKDLPLLNIYKIVCPEENVTAKAEFPIRSKEDIPMVQPKDVSTHPMVSIQLDVSDMLERSQSEEKTYENDPYMQRLLKNFLKNKE